MNDTNPKISELFHSMLMKKSEYERLKMSSSMFESAKKIILSTNNKNENWRVFLFKRLYDNDFSEESKMKIIKRLKEYSNTKK